MSIEKLSRNFSAICGERKYTLFRYWMKKKTELAFGWECGACQRADTELVSRGTSPGGAFSIYRSVRSVRCTPVYTGLSYILKWHLVEICANHFQVDFPNLELISDKMKNKRQFEDIHWRNQNVIRVKSICNRHDSIWSWGYHK